MSNSERVKLVHRMAEAQMVRDAQERTPNRVRAESQLLEFSQRAARILEARGFHETAAGLRNAIADFQESKNA